MKQAQSVEISYLMSGGVVSQRRLSRRGEWRAGIRAFALVAGMSLAGALLVGAGLLTAHRVVNALPYAVVWMIAGVGAAARAMNCCGRPQSRSRHSLAPLAPAG